LISTPAVYFSNYLTFRSLNALVSAKKLAAKAKRPDEVEWRFGLTNGMCW